MFSRCIVVGFTVHQPHKRRINYLRGIHPEDFCECPVDMRQIVKTGLQREVGTVSYTHLTLPTSDLV